MGHGPASKDPHPLDNLPNPFFCGSDRSTRIASDVGMAGASKQQ